LEEEQHLALFTMHHIVSDGWSMGILTKEIGKLYAAFSAGEPSPLEELPIQYADFAVWQRAWLKGEALERELEYWRKQLAEVKELELQTDRPRPATRSYRGAEEAFVLEPELTAALRELSRREGVTLFMTLLAAFQTLLYRYAGQTDIQVGTPIANRNRLELEDLIGFFANTLVLRARLSADISFLDLLHQVRETTLEAYAHDQLPFEKLVMELAPRRAAGQNPLFQVWFYLDNVESNTYPVLPGIVLSSVKSDFSTAKLDLALAMAAHDERITGAFTYATDLFEAETIIALIGGFHALLQGLIRNPECKLLDLPLTNLSENRQLIESPVNSPLGEVQTTFIF
jgi:hypothetical protein